MQDVIICPPGFWTPRISMHRCRASTTTPTPFGRQRPVERLRDLLGHALLQLQPVREDADQARDLAQADHLPSRQVAHVAGAEKRQHVVLAKAVEGDVLDHDHLVVVLVEHRVGDDVFGAQSVAVGELAQRLRHSLRRRLQTLALRVLAQLGQQRLDQLGDLVAGTGLGL